MLIIAGDCTSNDKVPAWNNFFNWLDKQNYRKKIMIAGNHDNFCKQWCLSDDSIYDILEGKPSVTYLCDSGIEFEGIKIWGSPWSLIFDGINPHCTAFTGTEKDLKEKFDLIPSDIDILITHTPPYGILDEIPQIRPGPSLHVGSKSLRKILDHIEPKILVCGHIHEGYGEFKGETLRGYNYHIINASIMNEHYKPVNKPIRIIL